MNDAIFQNKIYRAVHDEVCPSCGRDYQVAELCQCGFTLTHGEMNEFRKGVQSWGREMQAYMAEWRARAKE